MKTLKPFRLSILSRPYLWRNQQRLGIAIMALADLNGPHPVVLPDLALWKDIVPTLDADGMIDMFIPKARPEFLVSGNAYTVHQQDKTACMVRIEAAGLTRELRVTGTRHWISGRPTQPRAFDAMPMTWANAYGGVASAENPAGKGAIHGRTSAEAIELPNIEDPLHPYVAPGKDIPIAGLGPISFMRPSRQKMMGSYSESWLKQDFPGFFPDMNPAIFNMAPATQQWTDRGQAPMGERFAIWNMTPDEQVWQGRIPDWHARCFVKQSDTFQEVTMQASTVWFVPENKQILLIYHGSMPVDEDDALDVTHIMPALEIAGQRRSAEHYQSIMQQRSEPVKGGLYAFRDYELVTPALIGKWLDSDISVKHTQLWQKSRLRQQALQNDMRQEISEYGLNPDDYVPVLMGPEREYSPADLPALMEETVRLQETMQLEKEQIRDQLLTAAGPEPDRDYVDFVETLFTGQSMKPKGPPKDIAEELDFDKKLAEFSQDEVIRNLVANMGGADLAYDQIQSQLQDAMKSTGVDTPPGIDEKDRARLEKLNPLRRRMYLYCAQFQDGVARVTRHESEQMRQVILEKYHATKNLSGLDLTGLDLSGLDLRGADFSDALMEATDLTHCRLDHCNFSQAVLTRAKLHETVLSGAVFKQANLSLVEATHSVFDGTHIAEAILEQSTFAHCSFQQAALSNLLARQLTFRHCDLRAASLDMSIINELILADCDLSQSAAFKVSINEGTLTQCRFHDARLDSCMFFASTLNKVDFDHVNFMCVGFAYHTAFSHCSFRSSHMQNSNFRDMDLRHMDFSQAHMEGCDFSNTNLSGAILGKVRTPQSMFIRSNLQYAELTDADLMHANFKKADVRAATMKRANLFRANLEQIMADADTLLDGSYKAQANVYPLRKVVQGRNR